MDLFAVIVSKYVFCLLNTTFWKLGQPTLPSLSLSPPPPGPHFQVSASFEINLMANDVYAAQGHDRRGGKGGTEEGGRRTKGCHPG